MATAALTRFTPEQYLAQERHAEFRSEFIDGRIVAMTGSTWPHNQIVWEFGSALREVLGDRDRRAAIRDQRVKIAESERYVYPDVVVVCGKPEFEDAVLDTLMNPVMIAEALSPSTEAYDRGEKFAHYRTIPTLQEYVLLSQDRIMVERFVRHGDVRHLAEFGGTEAVLPLESLGCGIPLARVYRVLEPDQDDAG